MARFLSGPGVKTEKTATNMTRRRRCGVPVISAPRYKYKDVLKAKFHYAVLVAEGPRLVADLQRAGIWPITSSELARASRSVTGLRPASDLSTTRIA